MKNISILGVTGSIGTQALEVIRDNREEFKLVGISANTSVKKVIEIIKEFNPRVVAMYTKEAADEVKSFCDDYDKSIEVVYGLDGLIKVATIDESDIILTSVVGMIGLVPTLEAIKKSKTIALANKETLVVGGEIVMEEAKKYNAKIIPVDSEHNAIFQCLNGEDKKAVRNIIVTASGGPFRGKKREDLINVTKNEALKHPKWSMGAKISIDSATLMNKGLEVIEAKWLFDMPLDKIKVVVHPQSIVHSMVEYVDGSILAEMASTDMKLPIHYAFTYPNRVKGSTEYLNLFKYNTLTFEEPDMDTFKNLALAYEIGKKGGNAPTILNAANEVAVDLFLKDKIKFLQITDLIEDALNTIEFTSKVNIDNILETERKVREYLLSTY
ncbi:1-deoxy-D-xylulose-5-phosphate reductoisomerase [Clostridium bornimense]|uniref:1-deoxy-D-xylulose-5-phosphate reductoisomerase n=1 Tax=Clostridium bornimense TaxID=1216932 RepID=UPI001C10D06C|nr:1-deoxy-D-xylulose-5-phosphate reductoisomerase [Clostridium bornimense]MBU5317147.1 1-deoxy-D-xylulose-5-phosphate reductoisomerase [Clostridium bornimense]